MSTHSRYNTTMFLLYIFVGLIGQLIDGSLGMAYGVTCNTFLLALGFPPAVGSASVHTAEVVTTGISSLAHFKLGNVRKDLFLRLLIGGALAAPVAAYATRRLLPLRLLMILVGVLISGVSLSTLLKILLK